MNSVGTRLKSHTMLKKYFQTPETKLRLLDHDSNLCEGLWPPFDGELCVTEFTVAGVGGGQPLLQAALVHFTQCASAIAR